MIKIGKGFIASFIVLVGLILATFVYYFAYYDRDCDSAVRILYEQGVEFGEEEGQIGRCDGLCVQSSFLGCKISDDFNSWIVRPWGRVEKR